MNAEEAAKNLDPQVIKTYQDAVALAQAEGDQQDMPKAVELMEQAAEAGHPMAQCNMGYFYTNVVRNEQVIKMTKTTTTTNIK